MKPTTRLAVKGWREFQHYKDRAPSWIKLYTKLLTNYEFAQLSDAEKGQLVMIWLLASQYDGSVPNDPKWIASQTNLKGRLAITKFVAEGWLEVVAVAQPASNLLAQPEHPASESVSIGSGSATLEKRRDREEKNLQGSSLTLTSQLGVAA